MKKLLFFSAILIASTTVQSCKEKGCTDPNATNYNESAKKDDNSCTYEETPLITNLFSIKSDFNYNFMEDGNEVQMPSNNSVELVLSQDTSIAGFSGRTRKTGSSFQALNGDNVFDVLYVQEEVNNDFPKLTTADLAPGNYDLLHATDLLEKNGKFELTMLKNSTFYTTEMVDQSAKLEIIDVEETIYDSQAVLKVHAKVSCKLASVTSSSTIKMNNAELVFAIAK